MAKKVRKKSDSSGNDTAFPCQSDLPGISHKGFSRFEYIAIQAMKGMLANPGVFQFGLKPLDVREMITTASIQYAEAMTIIFDDIKQTTSQK